MFVKQLSVFVENRPGRLSAVTKLLQENNINIRALSIADTRDFGILRLIVNDPDKALEIIKAKDYSVAITNVLAVGIVDKPGGLAEAMDVLFNNNISVEYMYAFVSKADDIAHVIFRVENNEKAAVALEEKGFSLLTNEDIQVM